MYYRKRGEIDLRFFKKNRIVLEEYEQSRGR